MAKQKAASPETITEALDAWLDEQREGDQSKVRAEEREAALNTVAALLDSFGGDPSSLHAAVEAHKEVFSAFLDCIEGVSPA